VDWSYRPRAGIMRLVGAVIRKANCATSLSLVVLLSACAANLPPYLFNQPTLTPGTTYRYRILIAGCGLPIVKVNGRNWEPDTPWPSDPYPKTWKVTTEGPSMHEQTYLVGTVRLRGGRLVIGLPDGTVVNRYHPTTDPQAFCA